MISVEEARQRVVQAFAPLPLELVSLWQASGRVLGADIAARRDQPFADVSAMDGYAVRAADLTQLPARLALQGEVPAGAAFAGEVRPGSCVRIFTGAPVPAGADTIVVQEDTTTDGGVVVIQDAPAMGRHIRRRGGDFTEGAVALARGSVLTARAIGLAAAAGHGHVQVHRRPNVALLATGDELVLPGEPVPPNGLAASSLPALAALVRSCGGEPTVLGIAPDRPDQVAAAAAASTGADILVTTGGASVGAHDTVRQLLTGADAPAELDFWRIAMRPGKPLLFGRFAGVPLLGLPGNPVSSLVCALLFLRPALARLAGLPDTPDRLETARLLSPLRANDHRQDYLRASFAPTADRKQGVRPAQQQDSAMLAPLAAADALIVRPPNAPAAQPGEDVDVLPFPGGALPV